MDSYDGGCGAPRSRNKFHLQLARFLREQSDGAIRGRSGKPEYLRLGRLDCKCHRARKGDRRPLLGRIAQCECHRFLVSYFYLAEIIRQRIDIQVPGNGGRGRSGLGCLSRPWCPCGRWRRCGCRGRYCRRCRSRGRRVHRGRRSGGGRRMCRGGGRRSCLC